MPQSLGQIYIHAVFATKNREPLIEDPLRGRLHGYLVAVLVNLGCPSLATGGVDDHVHTLFSLARTKSVAVVMEKLKAESSRWMKQQGSTDFWWQTGYAAFSVGHRELNRVVDYIHRQPLHHRHRSLGEELEEMGGAMTRGTEDVLACFGADQPL